MNVGPGRCSWGPEALAVGVRTIPSRSRLHRLVIDDEVTDRVTDRPRGQTR